MKYLGHMFRSIAWWQLTPDQDLLTAQPGRADPARYVSVSHSAKRNLVVAYLPVGGTVTFQPGVPASAMRGEWFDPRTGRRSTVKGVTANTFVAPDTNDWVLLLRQ
jgi:hypothetical protein